MRMHFPLVPRSFIYVHRPRPNGSVPFSTSLEVQLSFKIVAVPPGWWYPVIGSEVCEET
jgi:hypothetical protein